MITKCMTIDSVCEVIYSKNDTQTIDGDGRMVFDENQKVSIAMYGTLSVVLLKVIVSQRPVTF